MPSVDIYDLFLNSHEKLDDLSLGRLLGVLVDMVYPHSPRRGVLDVLNATSTLRLLHSSEFLEGVEKHRLNSKRLVRFSFTCSGSLGEAVLTLLSLAASGALNLHSRGALGELHKGIHSWHVEPQARLVGNLAGELNSFASAGLFLHLLLDSKECGWSKEHSTQLLRSVVAQDNVKDLAGNPADLLAALPQYKADIEEDLFAAVNDSDASDADECGDLAGFVCGDDEVEYSGSEAERRVKIVGHEALLGKKRGREKHTGKSKAGRKKLLRYADLEAEV